MSKHPWRRYTNTFRCPPECPNRKPGCQDHCEQHARERLEYDERKKLELERKSIDGYIARKANYYRDRRVKSNKHLSSFGTPNGKT